jgi:preprotein translocase subunit YajC
MKYVVPIKRIRALLPSVCGALLFMGVLATSSVAQTPAAAPEAVSKVETTQGEMTQGKFLMNTLMFMSFGFLGYYMLVTKPQMQQEEGQKKLRESLKKNDTVIIGSGIFGKVAQVQGEEIVVDIGTAGSSLKVKVLANSVEMPPTAKDSKPAA